MQPGPKQQEGAVMPGRPPHTAFALRKPWLSPGWRRGLYSFTDTKYTLRINAKNDWLSCAHWGRGSEATIQRFPGRDGLRPKGMVSVEATGAEAQALPPPRPECGRMAARTVWALACPLLPAPFFKRTQSRSNFSFFSICQHKYQLQHFNEGCCHGDGREAAALTEGPRPPVTCRPPGEGEPA